MLLKDNLQVLSCFDGLGGGRLALQRLGLTPTLYCASEIDPYAIKVHQANFPDTIQLGDITQLETMSYNNGKSGMLQVGHFTKDYKSQRLMKVKDKAWRHINLLIGGSPCQGFSFAGRQLNFDDPRSKLFFEFVRLKNALKPKYFLLENVKMKKESQDVISKYMGVEPIEINSNKFSAQNRKRLYWTNLPIDEIVDQGVFLHDILEDGCTDRTKSHCIDANYFKGGNLKSYFEKHRRQLVFSNEGLIHVGNADINGHDTIKRVYHSSGKSPTLNACTGGNREPKVFVEPYKWRKLTPLEAERLQTVPEGYTDHVSNTQRYKMLGNGFTVDVIAHILKSIKHNNKELCL